MILAFWILVTGPGYWGVTRPYGVPDWSRSFVNYRLASINFGFAVSTSWSLGKPISGS